MLVTLDQHTENRVKQIGLQFIFHLFCVDLITKQLF